MRFLPGAEQTVAHESITSRMLIQKGINNPDFVPTIFRLWKDEDSPLTSILDQKGLKTSNLNYSTNNKAYRTVGSNHVQYAIQNTDMRKIHFKANTDGVTFVDDANGPLYPGKGKTPFYIYSDSNWAGYKEIVELGDNDTQLYILNDPEEIAGGVWQHKVKLWSDNEDDYVDPKLLAEGNEYACEQTAHEHDFSERGVEKYTFSGFGDAYLTLQRFKYSWSGTAKAMKVTGKWAIHNGEANFITQAEQIMMKRAAQYLNYQIIMGKGTVSQKTGKVIMSDDNGREVLAGNGIFNSGDGPIEFPQNHGWTQEFLESMLMELDTYITHGDDGLREVVLLLAPRSNLLFQSLMKSMARTLNQNIEGTGANKGIIDTYSYYELAGIRIIPKRWNYLNTPNRPGIRLSDGTYSNEWDAYAVPLGLTQGGQRGIELVQLRPMSKGTVAGIDEGGNIASSVDGSSTHVLFQNGVISQVQPFKVYRPYWN